MMKKGNECVKCRIKPFRYITANKLPKPLCNAFEVSWRPILVEMSKAPNLEFPNNNDTISSEVIETTYSIASEYLKQKHSCLLTTIKHLNWVVSTWSRKITTSNIKNIGDINDLELLGNVQVRCHKTK